MAENFVLWKSEACPVSFRGDWCFQVCRDEVPKDQVPDLPYLNATAWASHEYRGYSYYRDETGTT